MTEKHSPLPEWESDGNSLFRDGVNIFTIPMTREQADSLAELVKTANGLPEAIAALELARRNLNGNDHVAREIDAALTKLKG